MTRPNRRGRYLFCFRYRPYSTNISVALDRLSDLQSPVDPG